MAQATPAAWQRLREALLEQIRDNDDVTCRVPGAEEPISLGEGLDWLEEGLRQGLHVDYRLAPEDGMTVLWLQRWSPEEPRPPWPEEWSDYPEDARE